MTDTDGLAASFEQHRGHLRGVAYRMLGSLSEAEDAVQEGWLRLQRSDTSVDGRIAGINVIGDPRSLRGLELAAIE